MADELAGSFPANPVRTLTVAELPVRERGLFALKYDPELPPGITGGSRKVTTPPMTGAASDPLLAI